MKNEFSPWYALGLGALMIFAAAHWSCSSSANILAYLYNANGCTVTFTLDGANPVNETSSGGPFTLYTNVSSGNHKIGISTNSNTPPPAGEACNFNINGGSQTVSVTNPCSYVGNGGTFILACQ
jgi:hypothetical protein